MLKIDRERGLIQGVTYLSSPHHNERPADAVIDMIVIHGISLPPAQFGTGCVQAFFCGKLAPSDDPYFETIATLRVSAHLFITRTGEIIQFVPFHLRAWHAGESSFAGRTGCNDFSIGIELEGTDTIPYEGAQYAALAKTIALLQEVYPAITKDRIIGHADIAPGRKTDPGPSFQWDDLFTQLTFVKGIPQ